jgi:ABC-2 type transport system ATP-binding protein
MSEMALVAGHLIIVGRGRLLADTNVADLIRKYGGDTVKVSSADPARLREVLAGPGVEITGRAGSEELLVAGLSPRMIGLAADRCGIALFELTPKTISLEEAFLDLTKDEVEYHGTAALATRGSTTIEQTGSAA